MNTARDPKTQSVLRQIARTQDTVQNFLHRIEVLEKKLRSSNLSDEERTRMEKEIEDLKKQLLKSESDLKNFYGENSKSFFVAVMLMFCGFLFYGVYLMIYGHKK